MISYCTYKNKCKIGVYKFIKNALIILGEECKVFKIEKPEMINKTFRLPMELVNRLQHVAQNKGISLNKLVVQCCEYALKNLKD